MLAIVFKLKKSNSSEFGASAQGYMQRERQLHDTWFGASKWMADCRNLGWMGPLLVEDNRGSSVCLFEIKWVREH